MQVGHIVGGKVLHLPIAPVGGGYLGKGPIKWEKNEDFCGVYTGASIGVFGDSGGVVQWGRRRGRLHLSIGNNND